MGRDDWLSCFDLGGDGDEPDFLMCTDSQISLAKRSARCAGDRGGIESDSDAVSERPSITVTMSDTYWCPKNWRPQSFTHVTLGTLLFGPTVPCVRLPVPER